MAPMQKHDQSAASKSSNFPLKRLACKVSKGFPSGDRLSCSSNHLKQHSSLLPMSSHCRLSFPLPMKPKRGRQTRPLSYAEA